MLGIEHKTESKLERLDGMEQSDKAKVDPRSEVWIDPYENEYSSFVSARESHHRVVCFSCWGIISFHAEKIAFSLTCVIVFVYMHICLCIYMCDVVLQIQGSFCLSQVHRTSGSCMSRARPPSIFSFVFQVLRGKWIPIVWPCWKISWFLDLV